MYKKTFTVALAAFAAIAVAACGGGDDAATSDNAGGDAMAPAAGAVDPATVADPVTMSAGEVMSQRMVVNDNGTLSYVFVYVKGGLEGQTFVGASESVTLAQTGCMYDPHMLGLQTNQTLTILNNDDTLHNINSQPANNSGFNLAQPVKGMTNDQVFANAEIMVPMKCDVHPWMQAYVGVVDHPYFAVTGADGGFTIANLPAGTYTIGAWHESLGEQEQSVTVDANGTAEVSFSFGS